MSLAAVIAAAASSLLVSTVSAVPAGIVQWDIAKRHHPKFGLQRRDGGTVEQEIMNAIARGGYFASCSLGTPGQEVVLQLDTGSSDIWIPWTQASICEVDACTLGTCMWAETLAIGVQLS